MQADDNIEDPDMQIPKQPRTRSTAGETAAEDTSATIRSEVAATEDLNKQVHDAYSSYVRSLNSSYLQAQLDQAKAYLDYVEMLQQKLGSRPALEYMQELVQAHGDAQATADAQKKYALASVDQHAAYQKALGDAAIAYSNSLRGVWEKLQSEIGQRNQEIAQSLKDALLKVDVGTAQLPALSLLYQGLRSMTATPAADQGRTG
jgi:hypothetical protein